MTTARITHRTCQACKQRRPSYLRFYRKPKPGDAKPVGVPPWENGLCHTCAEAAFGGNRVCMR